MDARPGHIEIPAHKGGHGRDLIAHFPLEKFGDLGDHGRIHAVHGAPEGGVFKDHTITGKDNAPSAENVETSLTNIELIPIILNNS